MNDEPTKAANTGLRLAFLGIVVIGLFSALFGRMWFLQVLATEEFRVQAETNQVRLVTVPPTRGRILDRNGEILADNVFTGEWGRQWHGLIPHSTWDAFDDAAHFLQDTHGPRIAEIVLAYAAG